MQKLFTKLGNFFSRYPALPLMVIFLVVAAAIPVSGHYINPDYTLNPLGLKLLLVPVIAAFVSLAIILIDFSIKILSRFITDGEIVWKYLIMGRLFEYLHDRTGTVDHTEVAVITVATTFGIWSVALIVFQPWLLLPLGIITIVVALAHLARFVYRIRSRFNNHVSDPDAHK